MTRSGSSTATAARSAELTAIGAPLGPGCAAIGVVGAARSAALAHGASDVCGPRARLPRARVRARRLRPSARPRGDRAATLSSPPPAGRLVDGEHRRRPSCSLRGPPGGLPRAARPRSSCRRRWPSHGSTSGSTPPRASSYEVRQASTSRSSMSRAGSARTSSRSDAAKLEARRSSAGSTRP